MHGGWHKREILPFWAAQALTLHVLGRTIDDDAPQLYTTVVLAHYPLCVLPAAARRRRRRPLD